MDKDPTETRCIPKQPQRPYVGNAPPDPPLPEPSELLSTTPNPNTNPFAERDSQFEQIKETQPMSDTASILHCGDCKIHFDVQQLNPLVHHENQDEVVKECDRLFGRGSYRIEYFKNWERGIPKYIGYRDGTLQHSITRPLASVRNCPFCGLRLKVGE